MEKFYIRQNDELFSIIDNIKLSRDINNLLVVPPGTVALRSIINLRILAEESGFLGKSVYISTSDVLIRRLAKQAGIKILEAQTKTPSRGPGKIMGRIVDLRTMSDVVAPQEQEQQEEGVPVEEPVFKEEPLPEFKFEPKPQPEDNYFYKERLHDEKVFTEPLPERTEKIRKRKSFKIFTPKFFIGVLIFIVVLALAGVVYFVLPKAQIIITPKREPIKFSIDILADSTATDVKAEESVIPGQFFDTEKMESREFPSTGERDVSEKAKGKIIVYNQYSSEPQTLVKTTRFKAANGKIFRLTSTATIPGAVISEGKIIASSKEVDVEADEAGDTYNIGPSDFSIPGFEGSPKFTAFYGKSTNPMTGGAKGKMKVATQDDINGATNIVTVELKEKTLKEFQALIPADLKLLDGSQSIEVVESSSNIKANQPGEKFKITVKVKARGIAFKERDALYLIEKNASNEISEDKTLLLSTVRVDYKTSNLNFKNNTVGLNCSVSADSIFVFDEKKIKSDLAGKNEEEIKTYLSSLPNIETAKIVFWPFWVKEVPKNIEKIKVIIAID